MKLSNLLKRLSIVVTILFLLSQSGFNNLVNAQRGRCGNQTFCYDGGLYPPCIPLPTTLPAVSSSYNGGYGFSVGSGNCGAKRCYWFFACKCGPALGAGICTPRVAGNSVVSCDNETTEKGK